MSVREDVRDWAGAAWSARRARRLPLRFSIGGVEVGRKSNCSLSLASMQLLALLTLLPLALAGNSLEPQLVSATVSLAGALTRTSTTYVLKQVRAPESVWTVGLVGSEGYVEAHIGSPANEQRTLAQLVRLRRDEKYVAPPRPLR